MTSLVAMMHFYRTERPRLLADGIVDPMAQDTELERRWQVMQSVQVPAHSPDALELDEPLTEAQLSELNLVSQGVSRGPDRLKFIYALGDTPDAQASTAADPEPPRKRCRTEEGGGLVFELLMHLKKDTLQAISEDLALPVSGNKESLARAIVVKALSL